MTRRPADVSARKASGAAGALWRGSQTVLGMLTTGLFLWLAFREARPDILLGLAADWPAGPILAALLLQAAAFGLRLLRWGLANRHLGEVAWGRLLAIGSVGLSAVYLLPARLGELVRPALVAEESDVDFGRGGAAVVLERVVDGWIMSAALFAAWIALGERAGSSTLQAGARLFAGLFLAASAVLAVGAIRREQFSALLGRLLRRFSPGLGEWLAKLANRFLGGLHLLADRPVLLPFVLISLGIWLAEVGSIYVLLAVLEGGSSWLAALTVLSALVLATTLPSGPGLLGVFEYAVILGLGLVGTPHDQAIAFGLLLHGLETLTVLGFGLAGIGAGGLRLRRVMRAAGQLSVSDRPSAASRTE